jgi:lipoyl(octanoyl) transferase
MAETWSYLHSGLCAPPFNMALDEALLETASLRGTPVLRFYGWTEPAATFGYSQHHAEVSTWTQLRPLIRRPTGGGLVPHDADWTYSLAFPPAHFWSRLKAVESYRFAHLWVSQAFAALGIQTQLSPSEQKLAPGRCFLGAEKLDVLWNGAKLAGAAQRRNRLGLLIQGSVQPGSSVWSRSEWERAMLAGPFLDVQVVWEPLSRDATLSRRAEELAAAKYSQAAYNEQR